MSNFEEAPFEVGDFVKTDFNENETDVVRTVVYVHKSIDSASGWLVVANGGEPCKCCGKKPGNPINGHSGHGVDSSWFKKVEQ